MLFTQPDAGIYIFSCDLLIRCIALNSVICNDVDVMIFASLSQQLLSMTIMFSFNSNEMWVWCCSIEWIPASLIESISLIG
jgi:hypothetical protein